MGRRPVDALVAGVVVVLMMSLAGVALPGDISAQGRAGAPAVLLGALVAQLILVAIMGLGPHPAVVALLLFRMLPVAIASPTLGAVIHPRLDSGLRATYLSMQSLAGMLTFSASVALAGLAVRGQPALDAFALSRVLPVYVAGGVGLALVLALAARHSWRDA